MFSKAKRFEHNGKTQSKAAPIKLESEKSKTTDKVPAPVLKSKQVAGGGLTKVSSDVRSQCSSSAHSVKSFVTPKPLKSVPTITHRIHTGPKKKCEPTDSKTKSETQNEILKAQEVEIRNKDDTIAEYTKQIEEFKSKILWLEQKLEDVNAVNKIGNKLSLITLNEGNDIVDENKPNHTIYELKQRIFELEQQCDILEQEITNKQLELRSVEEVITVRDSLCQDLQQKLSNAERDLEETCQRLEMVKGHHALALEANESIRREYKVELEALKVKCDEEKLTIINKSKADQELLKAKHISLVESIKNQLVKEKNEALQVLQQELINTEQEMRAKLEQIEETSREKLRLCEIQFEEQSQSIHDHYTQQQIKLQSFENEISELKYNVTLLEEEKIILQKEINNLRYENDLLTKDKLSLIKERDEIKEESKTKLIDFENEINRLTVEVDRGIKEKIKFETSLSVTRDIVQVLTMRLRESDNELEVLEDKVQTLTNSNEMLASELTSYKSTLNNSIMECKEYKDALVNILKSKAALAKEHTRIMEHNVSLIESLQNVEKEAYRELGSIKNELIEDVELLKKESNSQIQFLHEEIEKKRVLCELATEHAGQATAAAEQSRVLLAQASAEINRLEAENQCLQQQIQDQQSLVVELSLLRQENEELTMTVAKQSSIIDKMKKDSEQLQFKPKSPSVIRKTTKIGKENIQTVISPLRERNH